MDALRRPAWRLGVPLAVVFAACAHVAAADRADLALTAAAEVFTAWAQAETARTDAFVDGPTKIAAKAALVARIDQYNDLEASAEAALAAYRAGPGNLPAALAAVRALEDQLLAWGLTP